QPDRPRPLLRPARPLRRPGVRRRRAGRLRVAAPPPRPDLRRPTMILHLSPDAPLAYRVLADAALVGHIGGGVAGIAAGFASAAAGARRGGRSQRAAGGVFVAAMASAYAIGAMVSPLIHQPGNALGGGFGFYLALTGWMAAHREPGLSGRIERAGFAAATGGA